MDTQIELALMHAARNDSAIYRQGTIKVSKETGEETYIPRTEFQEGWNQAMLESARKENALRSWWGSLESRLKYLLRPLLTPIDDDADPVLWLREDKGKVTAFLPMNDTFGYAVAECEEVPLRIEPLTQVLILSNCYGWRGLVAWAVLRRGEEPIREIRDKQYGEALEAAKKICGVNS